MTDKVKTLSKASLIIGVVTSIVMLIAGGVRIVDLTRQTACTVETLSNRIEAERVERITQEGILKDAIVAEREDRKADNTKLLIKLSEIDTRLLYIQQSIDSIGGQNGKN